MTSSRWDATAVVEMFYIGRAKIAEVDAQYVNRALPVAIKKKFSASLESMMSLQALGLQRWRIRSCLPTFKRP